jgi:predicted Zn-dependent protease with MMP-like domain
MVVDALDTLPDSALPVVDGLAVLVEDELAPDDAPVDGHLLGLFRGVPRTRQVHTPGQ